MKSRQRKRRVTPPNQFIGVLRVKPGDTVVIRTDRRPSNEDVQAISAIIGAPAIFLPNDGTRIDVIRKV